MTRHGQNRVTWLAKGYDPIAARPNGALLRSWKGDATCKSARLAVPSATMGQLTALTDAVWASGDILRKAWWISNGVDLPGNTHIRTMKGIPVDAYKWNSSIEIISMELYKAIDVGDNATLCVVTTAGLDPSSNAVDLGALAWGTPGEGDFLAGGGRPVVRALTDFVTITRLSIGVTVPNVQFIVNGV